MYSEQNQEEKVFFRPGECVTLRLDIPNKPTMLVVKKETTLFKMKEDDSDNNLKGIRCRWFTTEGLLQEAIFNTKDLIKL